MNAISMDVYQLYIQRMWFSSHQIRKRRGIVSSQFILLDDSLPPISILFNCDQRISVCHCFSCHWTHDIDDRRFDCFMGFFSKKIENVSSVKCFGAWSIDDRLIGHLFYVLRGCLTVASTLLSVSGYCQKAARRLSCNGNGNSEKYAALH